MIFKVNAGKNSAKITFQSLYHVQKCAVTGSKVLKQLSLCKENSVKCLINTLKGLEMYCRNTLLRLKYLVMNWGVKSFSSSVIRIFWVGLKRWLDDAMELPSRHAPQCYQTHHNCRICTIMLTSVRRTINNEKNPTMYNNFRIL